MSVKWAAAILFTLTVILSGCVVAYDAPYYDSQGRWKGGSVKMRALLALCEKLVGESLQKKTSKDTLNSVIIVSKGAETQLIRSEWPNAALGSFELLLSSKRQGQSNDAILIIDGHASRYVWRPDKNKWERSLLRSSVRIAPFPETLKPMSRSVGSELQ